MLPKPVLTRTFVEPVSFTATYDQAAKLPAVTEIDGGVKVGELSVIFTEGFGSGLEVRAADGTVLLKIADEDIDLNRPQGDIGLFVPDAGYPFGKSPTGSSANAWAAPNGRKTCGPSDTNKAQENPIVAMPYQNKSSTALHPNQLSDGFSLSPEIKMLYPKERTTNYGHKKTPVLFRFVACSLGSGRDESWSDFYARSIRLNGATHLALCAERWDLSSSGWP